MKMYEVEVSLNSGDVWISQDDGNGGKAIVALHLDQVNLVCEWLRDAALKLRKEANQQPE